jgi:hypothetical protein
MVLGTAMMTRRALIALASVCLLPRLSVAQEVPEDLLRGAWFLDVANLVNRSHPLAPSLWWLTLPQRSRGDAAWIDLCRNQRLIQTNMGNPVTVFSGYGRSTSRVGGFADVRCDGVNDYLSMPKIPALNLAQGSLVVSAYRTSAATSDMIVGLGDGSANGDNFYSLLWADGTNAVTTTLVSSAAYVWNAKTPASFAPATWHQFVMTVSAQGNAFYANGQPVTLTYTTGSAVTTGWWSTIYAAITTFDVGRLNTVNFPQYLEGRTDDVRIYNRALTAKEVQALYVNTRLGYPGLLRRLPLTAAPAAVAAVRKRPGGRIY